MPAILWTLFPALFAMAVVWLATIVWVFHRLRLDHPSTFEQLGSPSLFWNNSPRTGWLFLKFLFSGRCRELGDPALATVILFMRILFICYGLLFLTMIAAMTFSGPK